MKKRILSMILAVVMVISLLPVTAFAVNGHTSVYVDRDVPELQCILILEHRYCQECEEAKSGPHYGYWYEPYDEEFSTKYSREEFIRDFHSIDYTCNGDGTHTITCWVCEATLEEAGKCSLNAISNKDGSHRFQCTLCGGVFGDAESCNTNGTNGVCSVCGYKQLLSWDELQNVCSGYSEFKEAQYTKASWAVFAAALEAAQKEIDEHSCTTQMQINALANALSNAANSLVYAPADYGAIEEELSNVPEDLSIYTDESVRRLRELIGYIDYNLDISRQEDILGLASDIHNAIDDLTLKDADYTAVENALMRANECNEGNYTTDSWKNLQDAIADVVTNLKADKQLEVDTMAAAICDAIDALILVPEHEHTFEISEWNWISGTKTSATATFKCVNCDEGELVLPAAVTSFTEVEGYITYTASVKLGETEYTSSKMDAVTYTLDVINGTVIGGLRADGVYYYNDLITVQANEPEAGKYFVGWYLNEEKVSDKESYKFYLKTNTVIEAKYEDAPVELAPLVALELSDRIDLTGGQQQVKLIVRWELPSGYQPVEAGFVRTYNDEEGNSDSLKLENVDGSDIRNNSVAAVRKTGSYTLNVNLSASTALKNLHYVGYLKCTNAAGEEITVYTDLAQSNAKQILLR